MKTTAATEAPLPPAQGLTLSPLVPLVAPAGEPHIDILTVSGKRVFFLVGERPGVWAWSVESLGRALAVSGYRAADVRGAA